MHSLGTGYYSSKEVKRISGKNLICWSCKHRLTRQELRKLLLYYYFVLTDVRNHLPWQLSNIMQLFDDFAKFIYLS